MNYNQALEKLDRLKGLAQMYKDSKFPTGLDLETVRRDICVVYGELEEVFERFVGRRDVEVEDGCGPGARTIYSNYFEAGFLSDRTFYTEQGFAQLLKIIGRVKQAARGPIVPRDERSIGTVVEILNRFRPCCQYMEGRPANERAVQDIVWTMLRSRFDRLDREDTLSKFGAKSYKPDFGIPELRLLVEVKFVGVKTNLADIQEEVLADVPGYLQNQSAYDAILVLVYDAAQKLRDPGRFVDDLKRVPGIVDVIVVPGIG